ncbi:MAG: DNA polymerase beta superfamily protein [Coriobacteriia bacterium]
MTRTWGWDSLREHVMLSVGVGSHAWGLADDASDRDVRGVFLAPFEAVSGLAERPVEIAAPSCDAAYYEVHRAVMLGLRADPNVLEMLWSPLVESETALGRRLREERRMFVSTRIHASFEGYARSQLKFFERRAWLARHREALVHALKLTPRPALEAVTARLAGEIRRTGGARSADPMRDAGDVMATLAQSLYDRGVTPSNGLEDMARHVVGSPLDELLAPYRPKNAYHLVRVLQSGIRWLQEGEPMVEVTGELRELLLDIKQGRVPIEETLGRGRELLVELKLANEQSTLPERPDYDAAERFVIACRHEAALRYGG